MEILNQTSLTHGLILAIIVSLMLLFSYLQNGGEF